MEEVGSHLWKSTSSQALEARSALRGGASPPLLTHKALLLSLDPADRGSDCSSSDNLGFHIKTVLFTGGRMQPNTSHKV